MFSQLVFLPSILLSGIMFPSELLPGVLGAAGRIFPASWGFCLMRDGRIFRWEPVAAGSGDGNVVRSLHAAAQALGERVNGGADPDKMFWDKAVLFLKRRQRERAKTSCPYKFRAGCFCAAGAGNRAFRR